MVDPRFYATADPISLLEIAELTDGQLQEGVDGSRLISGAAPLSRAGVDGHQLSGFG